MKAGVQFQVCLVVVKSVKRQCVQHPCTMVSAGLTPEAWACFEKVVPAAALGFGWQGELWAV